MIVTDYIFKSNPPNPGHLTPTEMGGVRLFKEVRLTDSRSDGEESSAPGLFFTQGEQPVLSIGWGVKNCPWSVLSGLICSIMLEGRNNINHRGLSVTEEQGKGGESLPRLACHNVS